MKRAAAYLAIGVATAAAIVGRLLLNPLLGDRLPFITLFGAVALAVWIGGTFPAVLAAIAGYAFIERFVMRLDPTGALAPGSPGGTVALLAYAFTCLLIVLLGSGMRRARRRAVAAAQEVGHQKVRLEYEVAEHRRTESALRRSEADLEMVADRTPVALTRCSRDRRFLFVNRAAADLLGRSPADVIGRPVEEVLGPEGYAAIAPHVERVLAGEPVEFETEISYAGRGRRFVQVAYTPDLDEVGEVAGWFASVQDVSGRKEAETALQERERHFRTLVASTSQSTWQYRPGGEPVRQISEEAASWWRAFTGQTEEQHLARDGTGWLDAVHPDDRDVAWRHWTEIRAVKGPTAAVFRVRRASDGAWRWLQVRGVPMQGPDGVVNAMGGTLTDITEQREAEQARRDSEERFRLLADAAPVLVWLSGPDKQCTWFNRAWLEFTGRTMEQEVGSGWSQNVHPDDLERCLATYVEAFDARRPFSMEYRLRRHDGEFRWTLDHGVPLHNPDGSFAGYIGSCIDITDRKASEDSLREGDRRKDEFLATLAHELRNPLAPVRNAIEVLRLKGSPTPEVQWAREVIDRQMRQMARLIDDLLDVSRITRDVLELRRERADLATVLNAAIETSQGLIETSGHSLEVTLPGQPIFLNADVTRLAQVFSNLLSNASKFSDPGSRITLHASRQGDQVVVRVKDDGIGIPQEMQPRIFDIFVQVDRSLERSQGGLGIGLTLVKRLLELHGGAIEVMSDGRGKGSEFIARLPVAPADAVEAPAPRSTVERKAPARGRVLVADDNQDAAASLSALLGLLGYETRTASDGAAAVAAAEEFRPAVALLDIGMPKTNGYDVARHIRRQDWGKDVVLLAVTGWGQKEDRDRTLAAGFDHHLVKPVDPDVLANLL
ncbi:MAG TPA: PAS domain S-box protein, partial [Candidatus Polarisedimenticolia bacterium]|nr:PAS domain S-box protein [Candidatus Polarisedimenticolia bacterium]